MLVLLTKRKLRPDGCQTVKPPGILAMPNIFSPPFFFRKVLRQVRNFLRIPRMFARSQTNIPNPLNFILAILLPAVLLSQVTPSHTLFPTPISHLSSVLPVLRHTVCRPCSTELPRRLQVKPWPWPLLALPPLQRPAAWGALIASRIQQGEPARSPPGASPHPLGNYKCLANK